MMKEPEIMLFGTNILLPENGRAAAGGGEYSAESCVESGGGGGVDCGRCFKNGKGDVDDDDREKQEQFDEEQQEEEQQCETTEQDKDRNPGPTDESHDNPSSDSDNNTPKTPSTEDVENHPKLENEQTSAEPKALKKPDKILPCPRCNSSDTKFCYYNNYNVKQPRHFCKSCQRYWTAGGTMRNVPVGAGRRKHKNYASHFRHVTISEPLHAGSSTADGFCHVKLKPNGGVLSFGPDSPMASNMTIAKNGVVNCENGPQRPAMQNVINGLGSQLVSWPFHPAVYPPGYPIQYYYTPPVWNCNVPFLSVQSPTANQTAISSGPTSPLGKHSRNGELLNTNNISDGNEPRNSGSSIVVPKTLRIDDPEEAAKSSIWSTLGIEYDSFSLLKALQPKGNEKRSTIASSSLLQANPAALSRSISFHERV